MATEALTRQEIKRSGVEPNFQSVTASDGFTFPNDGHTVLVIDHSHEGAVNFVFTIQQTLDGQSVTRTVSVGASVTVLGPFPVELYNDSDDLVTCTPAQDSSTAVAPLSL